MSGRGVNVVGPFEAELGNGESARMLVAALDAVGMPVLPIGFEATASRQGHRFAHTTDPQNLFPVSVLCVNADGTPAFRQRLGERFFARRHTIGLWWWETTVFPDWMAESFALVDEVWAGSAFIADALTAAPAYDGWPPVNHVDIPVLAPAPSGASRTALGLPQDGFTYLYMYDHNSVLERKNPLGAIAAFARAFPQPRPGGPQLVLKSVNGDTHAEAHARVTAAAADRSDIHVVDRYLDARDRDALLAACDCYLSPHRAEGFGLTIAEALLLERPVVATGWSGSTEVLDDTTGFAISHTLRPVGPGNDPYPAEGQWAEPDLDHAAALLRRVAEQPEEAARRAAAGARRVRGRFGTHTCGVALAARLRSAGGPVARARALGPSARRAARDAAPMHRSRTLTG